jgi:cytochrome c-type biogenesis protein
MNTLLLISAAILGFLAFFEPCTIATHTLFAVRAHHDVRMQRALALAQLTLARTGLLALIFVAAAAVGLAALPSRVAMVMLSVIGLIYLVTRKIYLPVPHLEFFRLLPGQDHLSHGFKLGLTLPACTLPLVLIVSILSALTRQPVVAVLAGVVFALMFTLPTLWGSAHGLGAEARAFLARAALFSPYLTTVLLWGAAFLIWQTGV